MSIINTFDNKSEEILKAEHIAKPESGFPETIIVTFNPDLLDVLKSMCEVEQIGHMGVEMIVPVYKVKYKENEFGFYLTVVGAPATAMLLEEIFVKGAKRVLVLGSCGALDSELLAGHFIIPTAAYRDEGTSYHYAPASDYIEVKTAKRLGEVFDELKIPYIFGKTWTTDAFYRETKNNFEARKNDGCVTVDMECSAIAAVSQFRGVPVYQFLYAADSLVDEVWDARTMGNMPSSDFEKYLKIALETAIRL